MTWEEEGFIFRNIGLKMFVPGAWSGNQPFVFLSLYIIEKLLHHSPGLSFKFYRQAEIDFVINRLTKETTGK